MRSFCDRHEAALAASLLALFVGLASFCIDRRCPHADEVILAETSTNIAEGRGATATTHPNVVPGTPTALAYVPFVYAEAAWIWMFGFSRPVVQSFNVAVIAAATWLFWLFLARGRLIESACDRLFLVGLMPLVPTLATLYAKNRYDAVAVLGISLAAFATTSSKPACRIGLAWLGGVLAGGDAFHAAFITPFVFGAAWLFSERRGTAALLAYIAGVACGLLLTFGEMWVSGTWDVFRLLMKHNEVAVPGLSAVLKAPVKYHTNIRDNATTTLALVVALLADWRRRRVPFKRNAAVLGLAVSLLVPMALTFIGRYTDNYAWLAVIPAFLLAVMAAQSPTIPAAARLAVMALLALDAASGLPLGGFMKALEADRNSYAEPARYICEQVDPSDVVFASYMAYYPVKKRAKESFFGGVIESMTAEQLARVNKAVLVNDPVPRAMFELSPADTLGRLGGEWRKVGEFQVTRGDVRKMVPPRPREPFIFDFSVFERVR